MDLQCLPRPKYYAAPDVDHERNGSFGVSQAERPWGRAFLCRDVGTGTEDNHAIKEQRYFPKLMVARASLKRAFHLK